MERDRAKWMSNNEWPLLTPRTISSRNSTTSHFTRSHRHTLIVPRAHTNSYPFFALLIVLQLWLVLEHHWNLHIQRICVSWITFGPHAQS